MQDVALLPPMPNPARNEVNLRFDVRTDGNVRVEVCDVGGRRVRQLLDDLLPAGRHVLRWDGRDESSRPVTAGIYFARVHWNGRRVTRRLLLLR
jgi:flagellar hook assembly protein FlgD